VPRRPDGHRRRGDAEHGGAVAFVDRLRLLRCQLDAVEGLGDDVVYEQPLNDVDDLADVGR
jgi:hypothetical protein